MRGSGRCGAAAAARGDQSDELLDAFDFSLLLDEDDELDPLSLDDLDSLDDDEEEEELDESLDELSLELDEEEDVPPRLSFL